MDVKELILTKGEQPVAKISDSQLDILIEREFPKHKEIVKTKLTQIKSDSPNGKNRISASVLKLANKDLSYIDNLIRRANEDFRDIVSKAEYPRASSYDLGERNEEENKSDYLNDWIEYYNWIDSK